MADEIEISIPVPDTADETPETQVVVVETPETPTYSNDPVVMSELLELRTYKAETDARLEAQDQALALLAEATVVVAETAGEALEVAEETQLEVEQIAEGEQEPASEDSEPNREHWFYK